MKLQKRWFINLLLFVFTVFLITGCDSTNKSNEIITNTAEETDNDLICCKEELVIEEQDPEYTWQSRINCYLEDEIDGVSRVIVDSSYCENTENQKDISNEEFEPEKEIVKPIEEFCGDNVCNNNEVYEICSQDCPRIESKCANAICEGGESYKSCPQDCSLDDIIGTNPNDGACQPGEDINNAPNDCTDIQPNCGNGICDSWENKDKCYEDCPNNSVNGAICDSNSDCSNDQRCKSGKCVTVECTTDSDCSGCRRCSYNSCVLCGEGPYGCYC